MAESEEQVDTQEQEEHVEEETDSKYKAPAKKSVEEILKTDAEDESLKRYKEQLLGKAAAGEDANQWPDKPNVIMSKMSIQVEGRPDLEINLDDEDQLKDMKFVVKEGAKYKIMLTFYVQREIVSGLHFKNAVSRAKVTVGTEKYMLGSYGPKKESQTWKSPEEEFPKGMIARGSYKSKSEFTDDDKNEILKWEWKFDVKKDWD